MVWRLLRLQAAPYFVLGADLAGEPLRYRVATPWDFRQAFDLRSFDAWPDAAGQPLVRWRIDVHDRCADRDRVIDGHVEIRWSHGRFSGAPEAKVYLDTPPSRCRRLRFPHRPAEPRPAPAPMEGGRAPMTDTSSPAIVPSSRRGVIERAVVAAFPYLAGGVAIAPLLLAVPEPADPLVLFSLHLSALVGLGLAVTVRIAPLGDEAWFGGFGEWSPLRRTLLAATVLVVIPTGLVALVALATSAALRFDPSLQFLQLLSALDIAWAGAAIVIAVRWLRGTAAAIAAGVALGVVCVGSVWNYLRVVGFSADGGWLVDGRRMMQLVLPFDMAAAAVAVVLLVAAARRRAG
jgi:hypothetical protein